MKMWLKIVKFFFFLVLFFNFQTVFASSEKYLRATVHSFDCMRAPTGLVADSVYVARDFEVNSSCPVQSGNQNTSPTNLAMDLFVLAEQGRWLDVAKVFGAIEKLPYHSDTGLFFNRYDIHHPQNVTDYYVSSVDNIHLVLATWLVGEVAPHPHLRGRARQLFQRFNWQPFFDPETGLARGGFSFDGKRFHPDPWFFSHAGSEARSIYSLGYALGLMKDYPRKALTWEFDRTTTHGSMLRTWDGGAFQMLLPEMLIRESMYSSELLRAYTNFSMWAFERSQNKPLPALHSACQLGPFSFADLLGNHCGLNQPCYLGKAGHRDLISHFNADRFDEHLAPLWERVSTLHGVMMAAVFAPAPYEQALRRAESLRSGGHRLYHPFLGWMDSYHLNGPHQYQVVPMLLSLDQGMAALALARMNSRDGHNIISRSLSRNAVVASKLKQIYSDWQKSW